MQKWTNSHKIWVKMAKRESLMKMAITVITIMNSYWIFIVRVIDNSRSIWSIQNKKESKAEKQLFKTWEKYFLLSKISIMHLLIRKVNNSINIIG